MVIVLLLRSAEKLHSFQDLLKCRYVLFCFQIIGSHVSAAYLEYTGRKQLLCKNCRCSPENCLDLIFATPPCEKVIIVPDTNNITSAINQKIYVGYDKLW